MTRSEFTRGKVERVRRIFHLGATPARWLSERERAGRIGLLPFFCDLLLIAIAAQVTNGYRSGYPWSWAGAFSIGAVVAPLFLVGGANSATWPRPGRGWLA